MEAETTSRLIALSDELRTQYLRFNAALNNMIQGLCMFDAEQRLIVCNTRYLEMYGFSADVVKPGIRLREIMEYSVSLGNYRREDALRAISERPDTAEKREQAVLHQRLIDGRVIAVMHQPMPHGGSVATYEDVTQTVLLELARRGASREQAYEWVQRNAMRSFGEQRDFKALLMEDADISRVLPRGDLERAFDLGEQLRHVDDIFARVFQEVTV